MEFADLDPPSKNAKLSSGLTNELPPALLSKIFTYLPFKYRHQLCLVCSAWAAASRIPWSDITLLDLSKIPRAMVDSILRLCPMLESITAKNLTISLATTSNPPICANLRRMKLRNVTFVCKNLCPHQRNYLSFVEMFQEYFKRFPNLTELTWHDVACVEYGADGSANCTFSAKFGAHLWIFLAEPMASSIRRLVLIRSRDLSPGETSVQLALHGLRNLEHLYWEDCGFDCVSLYGPTDMPSLREVCLYGPRVSLKPFSEPEAREKFPLLRVLIIASRDNLKHEHISRMLTSGLCSTLRILAFLGQDQSLAVTHRWRELHGEVPVPVSLPPPEAGDRFDLPPLQIFVGGDITEHVRFKFVPSDVANFWRIDCPMPEYLTKPTVAEVFKDVWAARVIREGPANGLLPWGSPDHVTFFYSTRPLLFR